MWVLDKTFLNSIETRLADQWQALPAPRIGRFLHCEVSLDDPLSGLTPRQWFQCATAPGVLYWQNPEGTCECAGLGSAACFDSESHGGLEACMAAMQDTIGGIDGSPRFYGGMAFDQTRPVHGPWSGFGLYQFWLPQFECRRIQGRTTLLVTLPVTHPDQSPVDAAMRQLEGLLAALPVGQGVPGHPVNPVHEQAFCPTPEQWADSVTVLLERFDSDLNKVVLGCRETLRFQKPVQARTLFHAIAARGPAYQFYFTGDKSVFMGTSPECLYGRCHHQLIADALAGTRHETGSGLELMDSDKDNREHDYVVRDMQEALACLCTEIHRTEHKQLLRWHDLEHLRSRFLGRLQPGISDYRILDTLHPSAAVLGYARDRAWSRLRAEESFDRGWYAAPVGWIGRDAAEFAVAIRSALAHGNILDLYAGAGIVRGSDPQQEWNEILSKMNHFHEALGI